VNAKEVLWSSHLTMKLNSEPVNLAKFSKWESLGEGSSIHAETASIKRETTTRSTQTKGSMLLTKFEV
jgi:hypothetical protein